MKFLILLSIGILFNTFVFSQNTSGILSNNQILVKMYPTAKVAGDIASWSGLNMDGETKLMRSKVNYKEFYIENQTLKCLVLTESNYEMNDCHPCQALLGGCVLKKVGDTWTVETVAKEIAWMGTFGQISGAMDGTHLSASIRGVVIEGGFSQGGYTETSVNVLGVVDGKIKFLAQGIDTGMDNSGLCDPESGDENPCYGYTSKVRFALGSDHINYFLANKTESPQPYDMIVETSGTKVNEESGEVDSYNWIFTYQFKNGEYIQTSHTRVDY